MLSSTKDNDDVAGFTQKQGCKIPWLSDDFLNMILTAKVTVPSPDTLKNTFPTFQPLENKTT